MVITRTLRITFWHYPPLVLDTRRNLPPPPKKNKPRKCREFALSKKTVFKYSVSLAPWLLIIRTRNINLSQSLLSVAWLRTEQSKILSVIYMVHIFINVTKVIRYRTCFFQNTFYVNYISEHSSKNYLQFQFYAHWRHFSTHCSCS